MLYENNLLNLFPKCSSAIELDSVILFLCKLRYSCDLDRIGFIIYNLGKKCRICSYAPNGSAIV